MGNRWFLGTFTEQLLDFGGDLIPKPVNEKSRHQSGVSTAGQPERIIRGGVWGTC